jgi:hypothetical protein
MVRSIPRSAIEQAIGKSDKSGAGPSVPVSLAASDGRIDVGVARAGDARGGAEVWLCGLLHGVAVAIGHGENKGHTITYHNVVRRWIKIGSWSGKAETWSVPLREIAGEGIDHVAALLQNGSREAPKAMLGAALAALPASK